MNRRKALKHLTIATGAVITLPNWMISCGISDRPVHHTGFTKKEQEILASIADTIIPAGDSIGALAVETDKFLLKLFDDCFEKEIQDNIKKQMRELESRANDTYHQPFSLCRQPERESLLLEFGASSVKAENEFFNLVKSETVRGFNTSQKVMQEYLGYKVAPGHYYGCIDVKTNIHA